MKTTLIFFISILFSISSFSQQFEEPKLNPEEYDGLKVKVGADFALQLQMLQHEAPV